jgi:hypothetical protein
MAVGHLVPVEEKMRITGTELLAAATLPHGDFGAARPSISVTDE